jgi:large subunit ribosomal protein L9
MAKTLKLLLTENVDNLGIVGDVVNVRTGYARNFLLPRDLATKPSDEAVKAVAAKRAAAEKALKEERKHREELVGKMTGQEITLQRSCNDQGHLYAAVTQQDIAAALGSLGFSVKPREVRLAQTIKRIDSYDVQVKFDSDLISTVKVWVVADRKLDLDEEREEMEFDNEGNLIRRPKESKAARQPAETAEGQPASEADAKAADGKPADGKAKDARPRDAHPRDAKREPRGAISSKFVDKGPNPMERKIVDWTKTSTKAASDETKGEGKAEKHPKGEKADKGEKGKKEKPEKKPKA